jgi:hypothetical protein
MFRTLFSVLGRALALYRAEQILRDEELRHYVEYLGVESSTTLNDDCAVVRLVPKGGSPVEVEVDALVFQPAYTVYAVTPGGYRHIIRCSWSAAVAAAAAAAAVDLATYHYLFAASPTHELVE